MDNSTPSYIQSLDLSAIVTKLLQQGWTQRQAGQACQLYKNFLLLNYKYGPEIGLVPSREIDEIWHNHILDTARYSEDCRHIFGYYLHHSISSTKQTSMNGENDAFSKTQQLHYQEFGSYIMALQPSKLQRLYNLTVRWLQGKKLKAA